jgi:hypothetical protein
MNIHAIEEINDASAQRPPVLAIRFGRGRTGGTTFLDFVIQRARRADRAVSIADGDTHNATLARFYPPGKPGGALQPRGSEVGDVAEWVRPTKPRWSSTWAAATRCSRCMPRT